MSASFVPDIVATAKTLIAELAAATGIGKTARMNAETISDTIAGFLKTLEIVQSKEKGTLSKSYSIGVAESGLFKLEKGMPVEAAVTALRDRLEEIITRTQKSPTLSAARQASGQAKTVAVEAETSSGILTGATEAASGIFEKHTNWLNARGDVARMTIANAEIIVGSIIAINGLHWTINAFKGVKATPHTEQSPDGKISTSFTVEPMSVAERTLNAALGIGGLTAGIGATALGFSAFSHGH